MLKYAIDISNYSGFLSAQAAASIRNNVDTAIVRAGPQAGTWNGETWKYTRQQLQALQNAGLTRLDTYVYLNFAGDPGAQVVAGLEHVQGFPINTLWLDCEDTQHQTSADARVSFIRAAVEAAAMQGVPHGIYTGRWWWVPYTNDSREFAHLPLWVATNDKNPDQSFPAAGPFGGWQKPYMEQYDLDTYLWDVPGVVVDINVYEEAEPAPPPTPEPLWPEVPVIAIRSHLETAAASIAEAQRLLAGGK